jgi:hypothetical protein
VRNGGEVVSELIAEMRSLVELLGEAHSADLSEIARRLKEGLETLETATSFLVDAEPVLAAAGSAPYLQLFGTVCAGWLAARQALAAERRLAEHLGDEAFCSAKRATARFYAEHFLAMTPGYLPGIIGGSTVVDFDPEVL